MITEITFIPQQNNTRELTRDTQIPILIIENPNYISTSLGHGKGAMETKFFSFLLHKMDIVRRFVKLHWWISDNDLSKSPIYSMFTKE